MIEHTHTIFHFRNEIYIPLLQLVVNPNGTPSRGIEGRQAAPVDDSPFMSPGGNTSAGTGPGTVIERVMNVETQIGILVKTMTSISTEMKSFQRAVSNMDVLIRSVHELQDSSMRSESRVTNTTDSESASATITTEMLPGCQPLLRSGKGRPDSNCGSEMAKVTFIKKSQGSSRGHTSVVADRDMTVPDLRIDRLVRAANEARSPFRVSVVPVRVYF